MCYKTTKVSSVLVKGGAKLVSSANLLSFLTTLIFYRFRDITTCVVSVRVCHVS